MRVLLTGATGFIGSALATALRERGDAVVPIVRGEAGVGEARIDLAGGRIDASRVEGGSLEGFQAAVHLAGTPIVARWTSSRREQIRSSRIALGSLLARTLGALSEPPDVLVTASGVGYYGDGGEVELDESSPPGSGFLADVCRAWEAATIPAAEAGIRCVAVRTAIVLGDGGALRPQAKLFKLGLGAKLGSGRQWMSFVSLADEVRVLLRALDDTGLEGAVNAAIPHPVRNSEFTQALAETLSRKAHLTVPATALRLALGRGPADEMLLVSQRTVPGRLQEAGFEFQHRSVREALAAALGRQT